MNEGKREREREGEREREREREKEQRVSAFLSAQLHIIIIKTYTMLMRSCLSNFSRLISSSFVTMVSEKEEIRVIKSKFYQPISGLCKMSEMMIYPDLRLNKSLISARPEPNYLGPLSRPA